MNITLPFPPSLNAYYRSIPRGKHCQAIISKRGREYREKVKAMLAGLRVALEGRLLVKVDLYPPTRRKFDLDNYNKALLDALTHAGVWLDDSQIDDLRMVRREVTKGGKVEVLILSLEGEL